MKRSRISFNLYNWGSFLKGLGILATIGGILACTASPTIGIAVAASGIFTLISGVLINGLGVIAEASNKYLEKVELEEKLSQQDTEPVQQDSNGEA